LQLGRVDVDLHLEGVGRKALPVVADLTDIQAAAENQQQIGVLHGEVADAGQLLNLSVLAADCGITQSTCSSPAAMTSSPPTGSRPSRDSLPWPADLAA
jgi:hypothetical protein